MNEEKLSSPIQAESAPTTLAKQLLESWKDAGYRAEFVRERVRSSVALQIRALREQRNGMTQKQLGDAIGKAQTWISVLEDPEYGKMSVATLLSLAGAFDTDLEIKFRPFSKALYELTKQNQDYFEVRSFKEELPDLENAATLAWMFPVGQWSDITRAARLLAPQNIPMGSSLNVTLSASGVIQTDIQGIAYGDYAQKVGSIEVTRIPSIRIEQDSYSKKSRGSFRSRRLSSRKRCA
jgi:transcriptional regulator with XRE-family HTH domain